MQHTRVSQALFVLHFVFFLASVHVECSISDKLNFPDTEQEHFIKAQSDFSVVHPEKVDRNGQYMSYSLSHHFSSGRHKRDLGSSHGRVYYNLHYKGRDLFFNLTTNKHLVANDYILERRHSELNHTQQFVSKDNACHLIGTVTYSNHVGKAAISTCEGLRGFFSLPEGLFLIEPVKGHPVSREDPKEAHVVYRSPVTWTAPRHRRSVTEPQERQGACGVKDGADFSLRVEQERDAWEQEQREQSTGEPVPRGISRRSVSKERWVETLVVADSKLMDYHGSGNVESYIFTIMNMVAGIFHDASIGNAVHIILVRLILLHGEEKQLKIVHHADTTLNSFCTWQKNVNPQSDTHPAHHDVAVLITRKDICAGANQPCETLGLSHLSGMCQPHRSCNINEDSGLPLAFTIAHEIGHSFGIHHDGQGNDCELSGRHPFIMSRQLMYDSSPLTWSPCSKDYITRFLDRGWGFCLDDRPSKKDLTTPLATPGVKYSTHHQCQLQYGSNATFCQEVDNVCQILWCSVNGTCRSKLDSPIDGTKCGPDKWCISGECVVVGKLPETVNGGWGQWSTWSHCTRTCGAGVQSAERECNQPKPEFGGTYCTGERKRYRICNINPCAKKHPSFREMQCSEFNTVPYQNELYEWIPVMSTTSPCELHCHPVDGGFSEKMLDAVSDGTSCFVNSSRSICINGVCKAVGCDYGIDSNAEEDRCGVCLGDGSTCQTVHENFDQPDGYGYVDMVVIPEGARDIFIQERGEAGNFLAMKRPNSEDYYLNGNFIIQWNGEYKAGEAKFFYDRIGNLENLTSPGPTTEPIMIQLLFQERNPGINYEYTIKRERQSGNEVPEPEYTWRHGAWTDCSTSCGIGEQLQPVRCFERDIGVVDEVLCDPENRPEDRYRKCKIMDCPARWWVGGWQPCTATCGLSGVKKRTVLCVRTVTGEERVLHHADCRHMLKPKPVVPCNRDMPCTSDWAVGNWNECPVTCGGGVRSREVTCIAEPKDRCNATTKPRSKSLCGLLSCSGQKSMYHRISPKRGPTQAAVTTSVAPKTDPTTPLTPTAAASTPQLPTASDILHTDDYDLIVVGNASAAPDVAHAGRKTKGSGAAREEVEEEEEEEEEGSSADPQPDTGSNYTPGYDYIVDDSDSRNERVVDVVTSMTTAPLRTTTQSHTIRPLFTTKVPLRSTTPRGVYWTPRATSKAKITTPSVKPVRQWTPKPRITPLPKTTSKPQSKSKSKSADIPRTTGAPAHTVKVLKYQKTSVAHKTTSKSPEAKKLKHRPGSPVSTTSAYGNLNARDHIGMDVFWVVGNWSECSTTCGLGAEWRALVCSSPQEADCASVKKPEPARRCNLRPCTGWKAGNWSKCPVGCSEAMRHRDVQCLDTQSKRPLRPFHCQALTHKPPSSLPCSTLPCLQWKSSPWGKCSKSCGGGLRERLVYCPAFHRCDTTQRPNFTEPCNQQPCTHWDAETWAECSQSCGGGVRSRGIRCVNDESGEEERAGLCGRSSRPDSSQECNPQECKTKTGPPCRKNSMSSRFCAKLKLLGRCTLRSVQKQCCVTCMA
ncbi:A disintegrin and metalloproteinase with thrombospondin motifs 12 isoform X2 [Clupea harengus]|uniref:A disintegrin and metalloproteinase with thrombospondin motifs 12 isoform X2 n=1 Tax=Clupea harengus TaxID=7950 RepID=A0A6P8FD14_CLUHA|nr:A disintegrin and metalloproteinase with thrombospondin motifs 12 isoform X2 [Clupea harengus]